MSKNAEGRTTSHISRKYRRRLREQYNKLRSLLKMNSNSKKMDVLGECIRIIQSTTPAERSITSSSLTPSSTPTSLTSLTPLTNVTNDEYDVTDSFTPLLSPIISPIMLSNDENDQAPNQIAQPVKPLTTEGNHQLYYH